MNDITRIRKNWAKAIAARDLVGTLFYAKLFEITPEVRALFPEVIDDQAHKLVQTLNWIIDHLDSPETLEPAAASLARRHLRYGVNREHYAAVGKALIATLDQGLGADFSDEDRAAWLQVYAQLSQIMIAAAYPEG